MPDSLGVTPYHGIFFSLRVEDIDHLRFSITLAPVKIAYNNRPMGVAMQTPEQRIQRILKLLRQKEDERAFQVWLGVPKRQQTEVRQGLGDLAVRKLEERQQALDARRRQRQADLERQQAERLDQAKQMEAERQQAWEAFLERLENVRSEQGDAARIAAASEYLQRSMDPHLDADEQTRCRELRREAMWGSRVREALGCSRGELDRWDQDGRLPHAFSASLNIGPKTVQGRKWYREDVEGAKALLEEWRAFDRARRSKKTNPDWIPRRRTVESES
ncbi:hypothetical protein [Thioalkalivibrio sp. ALE23]|uniref:hypothetical protein n=1 Tax=Thioalkalivibrio sp. ALE23 TaxID=1265495 RepID=UPI0012DE1B4C|nr:hypothetical protein [Thioalkalivibrio sp. ALE23]